MKDSELIFGIMASLDKKEYSIDDLKYLTAPFDVTETNLRTVLSRMTNSNILCANRDAKKVVYKFCDKGIKTRLSVSAHFTTTQWSKWDNQWIGVLFSVPNLKNNERYSIRKILKHNMFACLYPGFWIRPNNNDCIFKNIDEIVKNDHCKIIKYQHYSNITKEEISNIFEIKSINAEFKKELEVINILLKDDNYDAIYSFRQKMIVGDRIIKLLYKDPMLPKEFLPDDWKGEEIRDKFFKLNKKLTQLSKPFVNKIFKNGTVN